MMGLFACSNNTSSSSKSTSTPQISDDLSKPVSLRLNLAYGNRNQTLTYQYNTPLTMPDGVTVISQGQLKPMWSYVAKEINASFKDVTTQDQKASQMITTAAATGFKDADIYGGNSIADNLMNYGIKGKFIYFLFLHTINLY